MYNKIKNQHLIGILIALILVITIVALAVNYVASTTTPTNTIPNQQATINTVATPTEITAKESQERLNDSLLLMAEASTSESLNKGLESLKGVAGSPEIASNTRAEAIESLTRNFYIRFDKEVYKSVFGKYPESAEDYALIPAFENASRLHPNHPIVEYSLALGYAQKALSDKENSANFLNLSKTHMQNGDNSVESQDYFIYKTISSVRKLKTLYYYSQMGIDVKQERSIIRSYLTNAITNDPIPEFQQQAKLYLLLDSAIWGEKISTIDIAYWRNPAPETKSSDAYSLYSKVVKDIQQMPADLYEVKAIKALK